MWQDDYDYGNSYDNFDINSFDFENSLSYCDEENYYASFGIEDEYEAYIDEDPYIEEYNI